MYVAGSLSSPQTCHVWCTSNGEQQVASIWGLQELMPNVAKYFSYKPYKGGCPIQVIYPTGIGGRIWVNEAF